MSSFQKGHPLPTAHEMQQLDQLVMREKGISSLELMESVAREFSRVILLLLREFAINNKRCLVLVGPGNNGGDGLVVSRYLHQTQKVPVTTAIVGSDKLSADCDENLKRLIDCGGQVICFGSGGAIPESVPTVSAQELSRLCSRSGVLIDALLGTGQSGPPRGDIADLLQLVDEESPLFHISLDTPTGISADTGEAFRPGFRADLTLTVQHKKLGMTQYEALGRCGEVRVIEAGIRSDTWKSSFWSTSPAPLELLPPRVSTAHKGTFGNTLVIAGSKRMPGAGVLAASGALSTGAGKVTLTTFDTPPLLPAEVMRVPILGESLGMKDLKTLSPFLKPKVLDSVVVGPGIGMEKDTADFLRELLEALKSLDIPTVVDADALNLLALMAPDDYIGKMKNMIITPHPGEAARLLGGAALDIQKTRPEAVRELTKKYGAVSLLKGSGTLIWDGQKGEVNETGTPYLATGGSGDVLSGVIAGVAAQGVSIFEAGCLGAWLHGKASELLPDEPLLPSSLCSQVSRLIGYGTA